MAGIVGYGAYIPRNRIKVEEIAKIWGADAPSYKRGLGLEEKSVPGPDQDTVTMSVEAARKAIRRAGINPRDIGAVYVGSESHPYAVKPSGTILAEAIGATPEVHSRQSSSSPARRVPRRCSSACARSKPGGSRMAWPSEPTRPRAPPETPWSTPPPPAPLPFCSAGSISSPT